MRTVAAPSAEAMIALQRLANKTWGVTALHEAITQEANMRVIYQAEPWPYYRTIEVSLGGTAYYLRLPRHRVIDGAQLPVAAVMVECRGLRKYFSRDLVPIIARITSFR